MELTEEHQQKGGATSYVHVIKTPLYDSTGAVTGVLGIFWDVTDSMRQQEKVKKDLKEKEILLKEVHHRVKNNMQIISSLLNLQAQHIKNQNAKKVFKESQDRVRSMALVHEHLYQSPSLSNIDFEDYINHLIRGLYRSYRMDPAQISFNSKIANMTLSMDNTITCGLIINELVSNALKYAFPPTIEDEKRIEVKTQSVDKNTVELIVADNGVGLPENIDVRKTKSLGLHLVYILTEEQLNGSLKISRKNGTKFTIRFNP